MSVFVGGYLEEEIIKPLNLLAARFRRSKSFFIEEALKYYIAQKMEDFEDEADADDILARANDTGMKLYNSDEALKFLKANCKD